MLIHVSRNCKIPKCLQKQCKDTQYGRAHRNLRRFSFLSKESMRNQFCTDLYTKVGEKIQAPGTTIHVFYAKKMGKKYLERYHKYFADPDICEYDLQHEELLLDADRWTKEVCRVCQIH